MTGTDIREGDTVRLDGERYSHTVDTVWPNGTADISRAWRTRNRDLRTVARTVTLDRLTLVRHGNREQDLIDAMFAKMDADAAYRDGTCTLEDVHAAAAHLARVTG